MRPRRSPQFKTAAQFFKRSRDLTAGGFYTTPAGMKDLGYTGNVPTATFAGPTPEVLRNSVWRKSHLPRPTKVRGRPA